MNGKPRQKYKCQNIRGIEYAEDGGGFLHLVFIEPCGLEFVTCGNPQICPRCHVQLPVAEK
jgi:hypothetical protein